MLGLFLRGQRPQFPSETGKRLGGCANRTRSGRRLPRNVATQQSSGLFLRGHRPRFPSETGKRLVEYAYWHLVRPPPAPKAHREGISVRKWQLDAYCPRTNCGGRVHRGVVFGVLRSPGRDFRGSRGAGAFLIKHFSSLVMENASKVALRLCVSPFFSHAGKEWVR